jgi:hypothetical protein
MVCVCPIEGYEPCCNEHGIDRDKVYELMCEIHALYKLMPLLKVHEDTCDG